MLGLREQVRVGVEREARPRMAEDAADLRRVEFDVDDQVAGERVSQVVEAEPLPAGVQACSGHGAPEGVAGGVAM